MREQELDQTLHKLGAELPRFPDGRVDYSEAKTAPVLGMLVTCGDKILIVQRSQEVSFYPGKWNWVSGFIDELKPLRQFVEQELEEETGITPGQIADIFFAPVIKEVDKAIDKTWLIYPAVVAVEAEFTPRLDWEADNSGHGLSRQSLPATTRYRAW